jgi:LPS sulfotransferase NodH
MSSTREEREVPAPNRFLIVCAARTGSTLLRLKLQSHPDVCCHGEIMTPDPKRALQITGMHPAHKSNLRALVLDTRREDPARFLRDFALYPGGFRAVGAKIKYAELLPEVIGNAHAWVLANKDLKIIHLTRQNLLRRLVSHELAVQSGVNMVLEGGKVPEYTSLQLDFEACTRDFDAVRAEEERFAALFADHPVIDVTYERVADPSSGECERILDFLGVPHAPLHTPMVKLGRDDLSESVGNYDELRRQAQGTRYAHYFD